MSLRFERKGSLRIPTNKWKKVQEEDYVKSWSYRQCQFACDYLNLMDTPPLQPILDTVTELPPLKRCERPKLEIPNGEQAGNGRNSISTVSWSSRASTVSTATTSSIGNYYGDLMDLGFELEMDMAHTVS